MPTRFYHHGVILPDHRLAMPPPAPAGTLAEWCPERFFCGGRPAERTKKGASGSTWEIPAPPGGERSQRDEHHTFVHFAIIVKKPSTCMTGTVTSMPNRRPSSREASRTPQETIRDVTESCEGNADRSLRSARPSPSERSPSVHPRSRFRDFRCHCFCPCDAIMTIAKATSR